MTEIEKYYIELGTTQKEYYKALSGIAEQEKERAGDNEKIYYIFLNIDESEYLLVEMEEGTGEIKRDVHEEPSNYFGFLHITLMAETLKVKGYIIKHKDIEYKGTFIPYFIFSKDYKKLFQKEYEILKKALLEREKKNDKTKK